MKTTHVDERTIRFNKSDISQLVRYNSMISIWNIECDKKNVLLHFFSTLFLFSLNFFLRLNLPNEKQQQQTNFQNYSPKTSSTSRIESKKNQWNYNQLITKRLKWMRWNSKTEKIRKKTHKISTADEMDVCSPRLRPNF